MDNKQYLDYHRQYMLSLKDLPAVIAKQKEVIDALERGDIEDIEYNIKMQALTKLESQLQETEAQKQRWINCGQVM